MNNVVIFGPQGSGKGTQGERLSKKLGIPDISSGALFRAEVERNTGLGRDIADYITSGQLVPSDMVRQVIRDRISEQDTLEGAIFDGYPRTVEQAETLDELLTEVGRQVTHVILLELSDEEAVKRLSGRRVCTNDRCRLSYHIDFKPPVKDKDHCDRCGSPLIQRQDDVPEAIKQRLDVYHKDTSPLIDFYNQRGIVFRIDGSQTIDKVEKDINFIFKL
jgi:adenylate kinase